MGKAERSLIDSRLLGCGEHKRLIRINAGFAWTGDIISKTNGKIILGNPRPFHGVPAGWPDLIGWEVVEITKDMVGKKIAVFCAEEIKATGSLSPEQKKFKKLLSKMGGIYRVICKKNGGD